MTSIFAAPCLVGHIRNQRDLARALDRGLQVALVHRARAGDAARQDFAALRHERADQLDVLVIDVVDLVRAELAHLAAPEQRPPLALRLVARLLVAPAAAAAAAAAAGAARPSVSEWHLNLRPVEAIVFEVLHIARRTSFARLALRRQPAFHAPPLGVGLSL